jgi:hypothetical protein
MSEDREEGRRRRRDEGNPNFSEGNPSRMDQIPNPAEQNPNQNPDFPSPNRAFSRTYAGPHRFFFLKPIPASNAAAK